MKPSSSAARFSFPYLQVLILSLIFTVLYIMSVGQDWEYSSIVKQGTFHVHAPVLFRFLIPFILCHVYIPHHVLDTNPFRFGAALVSVIPCFVLLRPYAERLAGRVLEPRLLNIVFFTILSMHYTGARILNCYYVYDFPAIGFYMIIFLMLTSANLRTVGLGVALAVVFSLSRETVIFATFHAAAFHFVRQQPYFSRKFFRAVWPTALACLLIGLVHLLQLHLWHYSVATSVASHTDGDFRFVYFAKRILSDREVQVQLLYFGCGILLWLPCIFFRLNKLEKFLLLATIPGLIMLEYAGNMVELRIYNEFVPFITFLFFKYLLLGDREPEAAQGDKKIGF
ncbi:MAG: hypothetical protein PW734_10905 [Verrucomicrobium sp.]|nr:hypothetical protein [Verrucomicrobium sp.]